MRSPGRFYCDQVDLGVKKNRRLSSARKETEKKEKEDSKYGIYIDAI